MRSELALLISASAAAAACAVAAFALRSEALPCALAGIAAALFAANAAVCLVRYRRALRTEGRETVSVVMMKDGEFKGEPPVRGKMPPGTM